MEQFRVSQNDWIDVRIAERRTVAEDIIALELHPLAGELPVFEAGAHVEVEVGPGCVRQYSLLNDPAETHRYVLGVLREPTSRGGSSAIHTGFARGATVRIGRPRNNFALVAHARRSILMAGGIGLTPLYSMAHGLHRIGADFALHYYARNRARAAFIDELGSEAFSDRVSIQLDDAAERTPVEAALGPAEDDAHLYVCGPAGFIDHVRQAARSRGWADANIHLEHFGATVDAAGDVFEVEARRSGVTVQVPSGSSIAQVLAANGVDVPLSCEQGVCGTCITTILEGVADHRDMFLSEAEHEAGEEMAICCSRAKTPKLILDL